MMLAAPLWAVFYLLNCSKTMYEIQPSGIYQKAHYRTCSQAAYQNGRFWTWRNHFNFQANVKLKTDGGTVTELNKIMYLSCKDRPHSFNFSPKGNFFMREVVGGQQQVKQKQPQPSPPTIALGQLIKATKTAKIVGTFAQLV